MSSYLAIGAVTALLKSLLDDGLSQRDLSSKFEGDPVVEVLAPDLVQEKLVDDKARLNLFCYQATPNIGWSNMGLPSLNGQGERTGNPPLALDLHYLLTAYSAQTFGAEILLGLAMQLLHETPVLTRQTIRRKQQEWSSATNPPLLKTLATTTLADQAEQIKITPQSTDPETASKLWTAFQSHFRPTAAYQVTVVLIESELAGRSPLPVLTRGPTDSGVVSQADLIPPYPTLTAVVPPNHPVSAQLADDLTLKGHHLDGSNITVRFTEQRSRRVLEADLGSGNAANQLIVPLRDAKDPTSPNTPPAKTWAAGLYSVAVLVTRPDETFRRTTNDLPFTLAPRILMSSVEITSSSGGGQGGREITIELRCRPEVRPEQRAVLLVGDIEVPAAPHQAQTDKLTFVTRSLAPGEHFVRLRVDGVDSLLVDRSSTPPVFKANQKLTIP